jgi:serine/threonine protein kinase/Tol biopolymer transport system component
MALDIGTRLGPYEILAPLGAGGMGEVYRARDTRLDRDVAIKVLPAGAVSAQSLERFEREAKAIAALNHPGICAVYDIGTSPVPFLVMELLEGETLHQRLAHGRLDASGLLEIALALADALATAHARGIVHRDLKPANIVLTPRGPKILDFGLARISEAVAQADLDVTGFPTLSLQTPLTDAGVAVGTVAYMSPEQLRGEALDARTDLFSLGLVLYEMATGKRAFSGTTSAVTSAAILHEQPAPPRELQPDLPVRFEHAILTLLEKDREVRTQTASELRAELTRLKRELTGTRTPGPTTRPVPIADASRSTAGPVSGVTPPPSSSDAQLIAGIMSRHRGAVIGAVALIVVAIAGAAYVFAPRGDRTSSTPDATALSITELKVETLTSSGTANLPGVSPDGNYVAYVESGGGRPSLRVRQVATGSNVEIVPAEPGVILLGATVTPDGAFVNYVRQAPQQRPELWQIPFLGGTSRRLLSGVGGRVGFSPDGRQMAFTRVTAPGQSELVIAASDGSSERVLATRSLPEGFLAIAGGLQAFAPAWSPNGTTIAALGGRAGRSGERATGQVVFVDTQTGAERAVNMGPPLPGTGLAWLDDRTVLLSALDRSSAPLQLWVMSYPDGALRRLTNDTSQYVSPSLTANRSALVVARNDASFSIWTSDATADRWTQTVLTTPAKGPIGFRLRWMGDDLVYPATASGGFALTRWRVSTKTTEILAQSAGNQSVSADGSRIVYLDYDTGELWKADGAKRDRMTSTGNFGPVQNGRLSPDGRLFVFIDPSGQKGLAVRVLSMDNPTDVRELTTTGVRPGGAEISPDGRSIAFTSVDEQNQPTLTVCDLDACSSRKTFPARGVGEGHWMPDGRGMAYVEAGTQDIWVQSLDGGAPRQLTHFPADGHQIWDFAFSADGMRLAVARARIASDIVLFRGLRKP